MAKRALIPHPDGPTPDFTVGCKISCFGRDAYKLEYIVIGAIAALRFPPGAMPDRTDGLWNSTCFEVFLTKQGGSYVEFNFAPSRQWAGYRFESYRDGMAAALDLQTPDIFTEYSERRAALTAFIEFPAGESDTLQSAGFAAVMEETDGTKSYWALAHPPGAPDFHHPSCFAATLPPPTIP